MCLSFTILDALALFGHGHFAMEYLLMGIDPAPSFSERHVSSGSYTDLGIRTLYHATNSSAAHSIFSHGFLCGSSGCVGPGIYFIETPLAARHKSRNGPMLCCRGREVGGPMSTWDAPTPSGTA